MNKYERKARAIKMLNTSYSNGYKNGFKDGMEAQIQWKTISKMIRIETHSPKLTIDKKCQSGNIQNKESKKRKGIKENDSRNK